MKLSLDIILPNLNCSIVKTSISDSSRQELEDIRFLDSPQGQLEEKHLYLGCTKELMNRVNSTCPVTAVLIGEEPSGGFRQGDNIILAGREEKLTDLFNRLQEIFYQYCQWERQLQELTIKRASLSRFVECGARLLGTPVSIIDVAEGTLAASETEEGDLNDDVWREIRRGYISTDTRERDTLKADMIIRASGPVQFYSSVSERILLAQAIRVRGHVVGFLSAHRLVKGKEGYPNGMVQAFAKLTYYVSVRMSEKDFYKLSRGWILEYILLDLIERRLVNPADIKERVKMLSWDANQTKSIAVIRFCSREINESELKRRQVQLENMWPGCRSILYNQRIVGIEFNANKKMSPEKETEFISWLKGANLECGISNYYEDIAETAYHYEQAEKALHFGRVVNPGRGLYCYWDYMVEHTFEILNQNMDIRTLIHPSMLRILSLLDTTPFLIDTLKVYLRTERNISLAAKELFIHKNTMIYRLKVLEEKLGCDLDDYTTRSRILYSIDVLEYLEKFGEKKQ